MGRATAFEKFDASGYKQKTMELDRKLQYRILIALQSVYPDSMLVQELPGFSHDRQFMGNLFYLQEHGLLEGGDIREPGRCRSMVDAQITRLGLDFLADDGGLASVLKPFMLRLSSSDIIEEIEASLTRGEVDEQKRQGIVDSLKIMDPAAIREIVQHLVRNSAGDNIELLASFGSKTASDSG